MLLCLTFFNSKMGLMLFYLPYNVAEKEEWMNVRYLKQSLTLIGRLRNKLENAACASSLLKNKTQKVRSN